MTTPRHGRGHGPRLPRLQGAGPTPDLWKHGTRNIMFTLVVDNYGIKFASSQDAEHLVSALGDLYVVTKYW